MARRKGYTSVVAVREVQKLTGLRLMFGISDRMYSDIVGASPCYVGLDDQNIQMSWTPYSVVSLAGSK